jgi:cell division protein FtsB
VCFGDWIHKKYLICLVVFISAMLLFTLFGSRGLMQIFQLKQEREKINITNAKLREENQKLTANIERLKRNKKEVEKIVREELGLAKKGEVIYQFER